MPGSFDLTHSIEILQRTPDVLRALLGDLSDFWTMQNYGPATFSAFDVIGHLIHAEHTNWMVRVRVILERGEAVPIPAFDRYAMYEASKGKRISELLETFASLRATNLDELRAMNLTPEQLDLRGTHLEFGPITLGQLLATWVVHDLNHLAQIAKAMAFQYRDEVGPWRQVLSILPKP